MNLNCRFKMGYENINSNKNEKNILKIAFQKKISRKERK